MDLRLRLRLIIWLIWSWISLAGRSPGLFAAQSLQKEAM
jgi:hypothetical protein